jgi:flagellar biosynthesis protein FlhG
MFDAVIDQASGLREMFEPPPGLSVVSLAYTRRGMGFRTLVINIAAACAKLGQKVIIVDVGPAGTARALGMRLKYDLANLLSGERQVQEVATKAPEGFFVMNAQKGMRSFVANAGDPAELLLGLQRPKAPFDVAILAGHVAEVAAITDNRDDLIFISNADADALTATYAQIKNAHTEHEQAAFRVLINRVDNEAEGIAAFRRIAGTARKFLGVHIEYGGSIKRDSAFIAADRAQCSVFGVAANSNAATQISQLAQSMQAWRLGRYALNDN